jgi:hypothetical protein
LYALQPHKGTIKGFHLHYGKLQQRKPNICQLT